MSKYILSFTGPTSLIAAPASAMKWNMKNEFQQNISHSNWTTYDNNVENSFTWAELRLFCLF